MCCSLQHGSPTQSIAAFEMGSFLPLPSWEAVQKSIGKGGNGTISIVYFKGTEFAVKRGSSTSWYIHNHTCVSALDVSLGRTATMPLRWVGQCT